MLLFVLCIPFAVQGQQQEDVPVVTSRTSGQPLVQHLLPEMTVTATREERSLFEVPHAVTTIEPEELARQTPSTLPDLLRGTTGVFVQQTTPGQAAPIIRGLIGSSVLMLVDGMRLNSAFFRPAPNQYFALVDPYNVEHLEIVRGPSSTLYGSDAMGGVIQVFTPIPEFSGEQWQWRSRFLGQFGSADLSQVSRFSLAGGKQGISVSGGMTYQNHDDVRDGGRLGKQYPSGFDVYAADGKLLVKHEHHDFLLNIQYLQQPKTPRFDELTPGFGQTQPSSATFFFEPNDRLFLHGRYRLRAPFSFFDTAQLSVAFQQINDDRRARDVGSVQKDRERNQSRLTGVTLQLSSHWRDWVFFTYGGEVYFDKVYSRRKRRNLETGEVTRPASRFADASTMDSVGLYAQSEMWVHPKLTVLLGGRFSYFDVNVPTADREVGTHLNFRDLTGSIGLLYRLVPEIHLVTNLGRGFRAPNLFDLSTLGPRPGNRFQIPSARLRPEQILSVDAGVKFAFARASGELFGFYAAYDDKIEATPTGVVTAEGRQIVQSTNLNSVTLVGVEAGGRWLFTDHLEFFGNFTYTWGEEQFRDGNEVPADRIAPPNGRVGFFSHLNSRLWVEPFVEYAFSQHRLSNRDRTDPRINPKGTLGWLTASFRVGWELHEHLSARLTVENLFDKSYRSHGSGINAPGVNAIVTFEAHF
jgi:outer membrane receptor protein involved in Fe transport